MLCGLRTRSRERLASPRCTQLPRPPPAPTSTQTQPSPGPVTGKAPGKQASLPRKEVGLQPSQGRRGRGRSGRDLRAQTQREEAQLRAEAQAPTVFLHRGQAHVGGHGHQDLHRGPALLKPAEPIKVGDPVPPPGLGPNHPGEPGRGSPASVGRASLPRRETMRCHLAPWRKESCNGWLGTRCGQKQGPTPALSPGDQ